MYLVDDNQILELFFARSEQAIKELDSKYGVKNNEFIMIQIFCLIDLCEKIIPESLRRHDRPAGISRQKAI